MLPALINVICHTSNLKNSNLRKDPSLTLFGTPHSFPKRLVILLLKYLSNPATSRIVSITNSLTLIFFLAYGKRLLPDFPELTFLFLQSLSYSSQICQLKIQTIHNFIQPSSLLNTLQWLPFSLGRLNRAIIRYWSGSCLSLHSYITLLHVRSLHSSTVLLDPEMLHAPSSHHCSSPSSKVKLQAFSVKAFLIFQTLWGPHQIPLLFLSYHHTTSFRNNYLSFNVIFVFETTSLVLTSLMASWRMRLDLFFCSLKQDVMTITYQAFSKYLLN